MKRQEKTRAWFLNRLLPWRLISHQWTRNTLTQPVITTGKTVETSAAATTTKGGGATLLLLQRATSAEIRTGGRSATTTEAKTTVDRALTEATATLQMIVSP